MAPLAQLGEQLSKAANVLGIFARIDAVLLELGGVVEDAADWPNWPTPHRLPLPYVLPSGVQRNMAVVPGGKYLYQPYFAAYLSSGLISLALTSSASVAKPWLPSATSGAELPLSASWMIFR